MVVHSPAATLPSPREQAQALVGRDLQQAEWAALVGAPDEATVDVMADHGDYRPAVRLDLTHGWLEGPAIRFVYRDPLGMVAIRNQFLHVRDEAPDGVAVRLLAQQVQAARALGVAYLAAEAAGGPGSPFVGYFVWPRLGFTGPLPEAARRRLPPVYGDVADVLDLVLRPGGADWWRRHGRSFEATFDLREGSRSLAALTAYTQRKGIRL